LIPIVVVRRCCTTHVVIPKLDSRCNGITRVLLFRECRHRTLHPKVIPIEFFGGRRGKKQQRVREPDMFPVKQVGVQTNPWHCCVHNGASLFMLGPPLTLMEIFPSATFATYYIFLLLLHSPFAYIYFLIHPQVASASSYRDMDIYYTHLRMYFLYRYNILHDITHFRLFLLGALPKNGTEKDQLMEKVLRPRYTSRAAIRQSTSYQIDE
jgi:hypothetical protein